MIGHSVSMPNIENWLAEQSEFELPVPVSKLSDESVVIISDAEESRYKQLRFKPDSNSAFASRSVAVPI